MSLNARIIRRDAEKKALIRRISDEGLDIAVYYPEPDELPHPALSSERRPDGSFLIRAPYEYEPLRDWLYCGNWQAIHPPVERFRGVDAFRVRPEVLDATFERFGIMLLIDSFHDDIEWKVVERGTRFLGDDSRTAASRATSRLGLMLGLASIVMLALAVFALLWATSAVELAFVDCNGRFAIDDPAFRCQRPAWLTYAFWFFAPMGIGFAIAAFVYRRGRPRM